MAGSAFGSWPASASSSSTLDRFGKQRFSARIELHSAMRSLARRRGWSGASKMLLVYRQFSSALARRRTSVGAADGSHLAAASAAAKELIGAIGVESRYGDAVRHLDPLQHLARL